MPQNMRAIFVGPNGLRVGWRVAIFMALVYAGVRLLARLIGPWIRSGLLAVGGVPGPRLETYQELIFVIPVFFATWVMARAEGRPFASYGLADRVAGRRFGAGTLWGFVLLSGLVGLLVLTGHLVFDGVALAGVVAIRFAVEWGIAFTLVAFAEEMMFRGYLQYTLAKSIGFWPAAILLSSVFGGIHLLNPGEGLIGGLTAALAGFVFCYSLARSGSLWWAIGAHLGWDWAQSYFYGVPDSGEIVSRHLLVSHPIGVAYLSGGSVGPEGSIFGFLALAAFVIVIRFTLRPGPDGNTGWLAGNGERRDERAGGEVDGVDRAGVGAD